VDPYADERWAFAKADAPAAGLDDRTWADLDLDQVIRGVDRLRTTLGRQMLYLRLRLGAQADHRKGLRALTETLGRDRACAGRVKGEIASLNPITGQQFWRVTREGAIPRRGWYAVFPLLSATTVTLLIASFWIPSLIFALACVILVNAFVRVVAAGPMIAYKSAFSQIAPIIRTARRLVLIEAIRDDQIQRDLAALTPLYRSARLMGRDAHEVGELAAAIQEYLNLLLLLDANALLLGARALDRSREALTRVAEWVGDADLGVAIEDLRLDGRSWCRAGNTATPDIEIVEGWHPLLTAPVPASIQLNPGGGTIVTGSNMSGKSTFLRTVGVCAVFAEALDLCPAKSFRAPSLSVHTCIGRMDDLASGRSYYLAEVERVLVLLNRAATAGAHLFLFDELFRGTNTVERLAAGEAVLRAIVDRGRDAINHVIVATHDGELVTMLAGLYRPIHFQESITSDGITFDYVVRDGPATSRTAIRLLESYGAPIDVVEAARARADELDASKSVTFP
jgi:hypothetical protein